MRRSRSFAVLLIAVAAMATSAVTPAGGCGGFFCQNDPVDQVAERILFTVNDDETITSLIEIAYQGDAADFSWVLPIPEAIDADALQVPENGELVFDELHDLTDVQFINPPETECVAELQSRAAMSADDAMEEETSVEVFASGEVGPFGFDVIGSADPAALVNWLRDNNYRVDASMEPLIDAYVEEEFAFIAMRLLDGETAESIAPIEITYPGSQPMIPIRLTAVAAFPEMPIFVWILADEQAVPENYEHFEIATEEITFSPFGLPDYPFLVQDRADAVGGQGFITEFAGPARSLNITNPYTSSQAEAQPYLTRLATYLDPEEMTVDPIFTFDGSLDDVSNIRDASDLRGLYDCERQATRTGESDSASDAVDPRFVNASLTDGTFTNYDDLPEGAQVGDPEPAGDAVTDDGDNSDELGATGTDTEDDAGLPVVPLLIGAVVVAGAAFALGRRGVQTT